MAHPVSPVRPFHHVDFPTSTNGNDRGLPGPRHPIRRHLPDGRQGAVGYAGTDFQEEVWRVLLEVDYGTTASYGDLSKAIGNPGAVRAVAGANGDNRMAILIPCHRIIGSDGSLTGYGGGLHRKRFLLELEQGIRTPDLFD